MKILYLAMAVIWLAAMVGASIMQIFKKEGHMDAEQLEELLMEQQEAY